MAGERQLAGGGFLIRQPEPADEAGYERLLLDPEVSGWLRPEPLPPFTRAEIAEMLADDLRHWRDAGFGPWVLAEREGGEMVGRVGLHRTSVGGELVTELAWTIRPGWQGRGLATAAAGEGLELARSVGLVELVALVLPANAASRRVAEKLGMKSSGGTVTHAGLPHLLYRIEVAAE
ncbi:MAG TPA: GNAT family N-acetyltransferase [Solirubrobacterales bacterium]|nr:GNAT family N-acetyltransferase [Solirubrobacterales bacterium]